MALAIIERREGRENLAKARQVRDSDQDYINDLEKNLHRRVMDKFERSVGYFGMRFFVVRIREMV